MSESKFKAVANGKEIDRSAVNIEERIQPIGPILYRISLLMPFNPSGPQINCFPKKMPALKWPRKKEKRPPKNIFCPTYKP
jgi:hypothetical protein